VTSVQAGIYWLVTPPMPCMTFAPPQPMNVLPVERRWALP
jgi:hypothetical protein